MKVRTQSKKVNKAWLNQHVNDTYVKLAQKEGYRARAAYKLQEIVQEHQLLRGVQRVVDLGSAPGAWSQWLARHLPDTTARRLVALDLLPMDPVEGVHFIQGDFREDAVLAELDAALAADGAPQPLDLVVSDMAPNLSGIASVDDARIEHLIELAVEFAQNHLKAQGALVAKVFHGGAYEPCLQAFRGAFRTVKVHKPKASRDKSAETFLVGIALR